VTTIDALFDTNILIAIWRGDAQAQAWLPTLPSTMVIGLPVLVAMELLDGARDTAEQRRATKMIDLYPIVYVEQQDSLWAQTQHAKYKLSHNVGILDALIASAAARLKIPIYTLNTKHFSPLPDVTAIRPY
jgi:predicted nucleic acid-binding protein